MKICHIVKDLEASPAAERIVQTCEDLHTRGLEIVLIAGGEGGELWARAKSGGYRLFRLKELSGAGSNPIRDAWCGILVVRLLSQLQPEIVHTHGHRAGVQVNRGAKRLPDIKIVHSLLETELKQERSLIGRWRYRRWERESIRRAGAVVCSSDGSAGRVRRLGVIEGKPLHIVGTSEELEGVYRRVLSDLKEV